MDVIQVEAKAFYVRLVCNKGRQIAASIFKALESLTGFNVQSSNLATSTNDYVLTFTLNVSFDIANPLSTYCIYFVVISFFTF